MNTSKGGSGRARFRVAGLAFLSGLLATIGCAPDPGSGPLIAPRVANSTLLSCEALVPNQDYSNPGNLEPFGSLWAQLDEATPDDDASYIWRYRIGQPPTVNEATVSLSDPVGSPSSGQATLTVRWKVVGNYSTQTPQPTKLTYSLMYLGTTVLGTKTIFPTGSSYVTDSFVVSIPPNTDYRQLQVKFQLELKPMSPPADTEIQARITWATLEVC
jgi:hypothetical protein